MGIEFWLEFVTTMFEFAKSIFKIFAENPILLLPIALGILNRRLR